MPVESPLTQTFGVEIECVAKCSFEEIDKVQIEQGLEAGKALSMNENREIITNVIRNTLANAGIPVNSPALNDFRTYINRLVKTGIPVHTPASNEPALYDFSTWVIDDDRSIVPLEECQGPDTKTPFGYFSFELKSRVLKVDPTGFEEVRLVLSLIKSRVELITNLSCGLHVHVGNAEKGYPLRTLKNFALLVTRFEREIHRLHPDERVIYPGVRRWCCPPSQLLQPRDPLLSGRCIENVKTLEELQSLMNPVYYRNAAYNFLHLAEPGGEFLDSYQTIEFRQHAASVDADEILAWVEFTTGMVRYSHHLVDSVWLFDLCSYCPTDDSFGILDLMRKFGQEDLVTFYRTRLHPKHRPEYNKSMGGQRHGFWRHMINQGNGE